MKVSIYSTASADVARRLGKLAKLYEQGQASPLMASTLDKLIDYETRLSQAQLRELRGDLARFEQQYGMSSIDFYQAYQSGKTDDRMDFVEWASLVQMVQNLERRLDLLIGKDQQ
jgi:hypothetical protein